MTRSKTFWAVAALLSLGVAAFSGYSVYERLALHLSGDTVELKPSAVPPPESAAAVPPAEDDGGKAQPEKTPADAAKAEDAKKPRAVRTAFEYKDAKAKSVSIAGSFTSWKEMRMTKKDGVWRKEEYVLPGTYPYHFVVDGKKKTDPGKPVSPSGDSLLTVSQ